MPSNYEPTVSTQACRDLANRCVSAKSPRGVLRILKRFLATLPDDGKRGTWFYYTKRFIDAMESGEQAFQVFKTTGNTKLPFAAFSTLPDVTCPGAGDCLDYCYSFRAWRYPAAFFRQLQNTLLLKHNPEIVEQAFLALKENIDVRLYVDGDFDSTERVEFWMALIAKRADLRVYGYSKSWANLLEFDRNGGVWPENYTLNLSSGSKYENLPGWKEAMRALPITRGEFVAVKIDDSGLPRGFARYESPEYHNRVREALREQFGRKSVSCPGKCGDCGNKQHWCGDSGLHEITIGIGIH